MSWKMSDLTNKDAEQDTKIAVIDSTLDNSIRRIEMVHKRVDDTNDELEKLRDRIRVLERWVAGAGAVIAATTFIVGIVASSGAETVFEEEQTIGVLTDKIREWEIEQSRTKPEDVLNNALKEWELWQE